MTVNWMFAARLLLWLIGTPVLFYGVREHSLWLAWCGVGCIITSGYLPDIFRKRDQDQDHCRHS